MTKKMVTKCCHEQSLHCVMITQTHVDPSILADAETVKLFILLFSNDPVWIKDEVLLFCFGLFLMLDIKKSLYAIIVHCSVIQCFC